MYHLNKLVGFLIGKEFVGVLLIVASCLVVARFECGKGRRARRWAIGLGLLAACWLWAGSTPAFERLIGLRLERGFPPQPVEALPQADAIVVLGGGMASNTNVSPYAEMSSAADRVWHAARLYKAGKAPTVVASGTNDRTATLPLLVDLGVPADAVRIEDKARNTEENARFVRDLLMDGDEPPAARPKILLVTSSWHMKRSLLMFERYAPELEVVPAAADYETLLSRSGPLSLRDFFPSPDSSFKNGIFMKEWVGYWGYRLFR